MSTLYLLIKDFKKIGLLLFNVILLIIFDTWFVLFIILFLWMKLLLLAWRLGFWWTQFDEFSSGSFINTLLKLVSWAFLIRKVERRRMFFVFFDQIQNITIFNPILDYNSYFLLKLFLSLFLIQPYKQLPSTDILISSWRILHPIHQFKHITYFSFLKNHS